MLEISRSYQRLVQHDSFGGKRFESSTFFSAYKQSDIPNDADPKDIAIITEGLFNLAKADVEKDIERLKKELDPKNQSPF